MSHKIYTWIFNFPQDSITEKLIHKADVTITNFNPMELSSFLTLQGMHIPFTTLEQKIKKYSLSKYGELQLLGELGKEGERILKY